MRRTVVLTALVLGLASPALAQDARLAARLDPVTAQSVQRLADSAASEGLPAEPLVLKALEGQSKGAEPARIVAAVRQLRAHLAAARQALGPGAAAADLVAGAASLRAGATPDALQSLRSLRPGRSLVVPLGVLTDLVARGMPVESAWRSVERLAEADATDAEFVALRERLERDGAQRGLPPPPPDRPRGMPPSGSPRIQ